RSSMSSSFALSTVGAPKYCFRMKLWKSSSRVSFSSSVRGEKRSATRTARLATLSSYAGPMPRPVVPMANGPLARSRALSSATCDERISGHAGETRSRSATGTPRATSPAISFASASSDTTTPLPMRLSTPSRRIPDGIRCRTVFSPSITSVWPALWPPWKRTTACACSAKPSTIAPLPASPHWVPITATLRPTLPSYDEQQQQAADDGDEPERAELRVLEPRDRCEPAAPCLRRSEREQALEDQVEREARKKIRPGHSSSLRTGEFEELLGGDRRYA